jgi:hypothetical protein
MTRAEIIAEIARLEAQLVILNLVPTDSYPFGTVVVFAADNNRTKWHYLKTGEEAWKKFGFTTEMTLAEWILSAKESEVGYFEVYVLTVAANPIYTSA